MSSLTDDDKQLLLRLARQALEEATRYHRLSEIEPPEGPVREKCGAFVTLHKGKRLRGCIGYVEPIKPLYQTVRECAMAAALHDPRFEPVRPEEAPALTVEISALSRLFDIEPERVEVGRHGLLISQGGARGLLLPQVPVEWGWDRETFLRETCLKAGLRPDAWRHRARIQAFTAEVFSEQPRDQLAAVDDSG